jgi:hypothetical protein
MSVAPYFFGGCSFAQPSGLAPFREKRHFALNQGTPKAVFYIFPAVSRSQYFSTLRKLRSVPVLRWLFDCRNPATALLEKQ